MLTCSYFSRLFLGEKSCELEVAYNGVMNKLLLICTAGVLLSGCGGSSVVLVDSRLADKEPLHAHVQGSDELVVEAAGRRLTAQVRDERAEFDVSELAPGKHTLRVIRPEGIKPLSFSIDRTNPAITLDRQLVTEDPARLELRTEPGAKVHIGSLHKRADARGALKVEVTCKDLEDAIDVKDLAGNASSQPSPVCDLNPPVASNVGEETNQAQAQLDAEWSDETSVRVQAWIDGERALWRSGKVLASKRLSEGTHTLKMRAVDEAGRSSDFSHDFVVDSTEKLGANALALGARGADVQALQQRLHVSGAEFNTGTFGSNTRAAVRSFQQSVGLPADAVAGEMTLSALMNVITIDQSSHTLTFRRNGKVVKSYPVSVGASDHPTPNGSFVIVVKQKDPTWTPPDSKWAEGLAPVPPGPDNPLGTRWMGISAPAIGIHGTNSPTSIGYSVSHGCIRMQIPDVEDLFERVSVGTRVVIQP